MHQNRSASNRFCSARGIFHSKFSFPCRIHHAGYRILVKVEGKAFIYLLILLVVIEMAKLVIKTPKELEREVETWEVDLQPLFLTFLRHEFVKVKE